MTAWTDLAADYIRLRRQLGADLHWPEHLLGQLCVDLDAAGCSVLTVDFAIAWSSVLPGGVADPPPSRATTRMTAIRGFATHLHALNPDHEVPPAGIFPAQPHRARPYIYTGAEIAAVIRAAATLTGELRVRTFPVVFALLAATGMRIGGALTLDRDTVDLDDGVLLIRQGKNGDPRLVPLHASAVAALEQYSRRRGEHRVSAQGQAFFADSRGRRVKYPTVLDAFVHASTAAGLRTATQRPRMHDLRHTFAVNTLLGWYREGADVAAKMPALSVYLGHSDPANTYWYVSAVPELLAHAATRLGARVLSGAGES